MAIKMKHSMLVLGVVIGFCFLASSAWAQSLQPANFALKPLSHQSTSSKKFISLTGAASGRAVSAGKKLQLRSDKRALKRGFLRLDRSLLTVNARRPKSPVIVTRPTDFSDAKKAQEITKDRANKRLRNRRSVIGHIWPVLRDAVQYLSSPYGPRKDPFTGKSAFHGGIDIAAEKGTPVLASARGIVKQSGEKGRLGKHVSIIHADGTTSKYGHLSRALVRVGQRVRQGQKIGEIGSTGRSTGPHLDFRISKNGQSMNPLKFVRPPNASQKTQAIMRRMKTAQNKRTLRTLRVIKVE
jgi:murein DD-endopeptidase MepM/ murein hydrolase activator NlpD